MSNVKEGYFVEIKVEGKPERVGVVRQVIGSQKEQKICVAFEGLSQTEVFALRNVTVLSKAEFEKWQQAQSRGAQGTRVSSSEHMMEPEPEPEPKKTLEHVYPVPSERCMTHGKKIFYKDIFLKYLNDQMLLNDLKSQLRIPEDGNLEKPITIKMKQTHYNSNFQGSSFIEFYSSVTPIALAIIYLSLYGNDQPEEKKNIHDLLIKACEKLSKDEVSDLFNTGKHNHKSYSAYMFATILKSHEMISFIEDIAKKYDIELDKTYKNQDGFSIAQFERYEALSESRLERLTPYKDTCKEVSHSKFRDFEQIDYCFVQINSADWYFARWAVPETSEISSDKELEKIMDRWEVTKENSPHIYLDRDPESKIPSVFARHAIEKGAFIDYYSGNRPAYIQEKGSLYGLRSGHVEPMGEGLTGNLTLLINHGVPNVTWKLCETPLGPIVWVEAIRPIEVGEELLLNYGKCYSKKFDYSAYQVKGYPQLLSVLSEGIKILAERPEEWSSFVIENWRVIQFLFEDEPILLTLLLDREHKFTLIDDLWQIFKNFELYLNMFNERCRNVGEEDNCVVLSGLCDKFIKSDDLLRLDKKVSSGKGKKKGKKKKTSILEDIRALTSIPIQIEALKKVL